MCKDCWFSKYNRVLLHYSVSMAAAAAEAVAYFPLSAAAYIPLSAAAAAEAATTAVAAAAANIPLSAAAYIPLSAADTHHCSVDTNELFHAYFFYVST